jgi:hypothetical protein
MRRRKIRLPVVRVVDGVVELSLRHTPFSQVVSVRRTDVIALLRLPFFVVIFHRLSVACIVLVRSFVVDG